MTSYLRSSNVSALDQERLYVWFGIRRFVRSAALISISEKERRVTHDASWVGASMHHANTFSRLTP